MTRSLIGLTVLALVVLVAPEALAQPNPPGSGGSVTPVPLDGGLGLLALAGGAYAARRLRAKS